MPAPQPSPGSGAPRRLAVLVATAIALVVLGTVGVVQLFGDDHSQPDGTVAQPTATPPPVPSTVPHPTPAAPSSLAEALSRLEGVIAEGQQAGGIRQDTAIDLRNLLRELHPTETRAVRVDELRQKVAVRAGEGAISGAYAQRLDVALAGFPTG